MAALSPPRSSLTRGASARRWQHAGARIAFTIAVATLTGCPARPPVALPRIPAKLPAASELDAALTARRRAVRSLRALARLRYRSPDGSSTSREAIALARPARLRVEVLSFFGAVFVLTTHEGTFTAYARRDNTLYRGVASPENMWRYARIGLPIVDLVDLVLGTPPQRKELWSYVSFDPQTGWVQLSQELEEGAQIVWFDGRLPRAAEYRDEYGDVRWRALYEAYEDHRGVKIATRIRLEVADRAHSVEIELDDIDVNPNLGDSVFTFVPPQGSTVVDLDLIREGSRPAAPGAAVR